MSGSNHKENSNNEYPSIAEADWYVLAIVSSIFTFVGAGFALWWIFHGVYPDKVAERATIAGMVVTFGGVATTFCTVVWRGKITTRQADVALEQNAATQKQISLTENNNLVTLLQKGAEFIDDKENRTKRAAGVASLNFVLFSNNNSFAETASSLLIDFVEVHGREFHHDKVIKDVIGNINKYNVDNNLIVYRRIWFSTKQNFNNRNAMFLWVVMKNVFHVSYHGGFFYRDDFSNYNNACKIEFEDVLFRQSTIVVGGGFYYKNCKFDNCEFVNLNTQFLNDHIFVNGDFSSTKIVVNSDFPDLRGGNNFYANEKPILSQLDQNKSINLTDVLLEKVV